MCGIFGVVSNRVIDKNKLKKIVDHSKQRGKDSSGLIYIENDTYQINRADFEIDKLLANVKPYKSNIVLGHSRLITNGLGDNQPVLRGKIAAIHNGIIINEDEVWSKLSVKRLLNIDSELIVAIAEEHLRQNKPLEEIPLEILSLCKGVISCALVLPEHGKLLLFSNNGSLYIGESDGRTYFASESYGLHLINCKNIAQIKNEFKILDIPNSNLEFNIIDKKSRIENLIPEFKINTAEQSLLLYEIHNIKRCTKCILPETMPFIKFDSLGVCNYCNNYKPRNNPKPKNELFELMEPYRRKGKELDCIVPFSGGRDSCYGLHLIMKELKMKPVTYTYDWGMVTDLGRRNISRMCAQMGVENIIVAADISQKRKNIRMNLLAWLKSPHLGMMAMLTAGDKHFFRHVESIKKQTGINLEISESVDMMRVLEHGYKVKMVKTEYETQSVDTPNDLLKVESAIQSNNLV